MNLFPNLQLSAATDAEEEKPKNPFPNGPRDMKTLSVGRVESRIRRHEAAQQRKINRRHRMKWLDSRFTGALLETKIRRAEAGHEPSLAQLGGDLVAARKALREIRGQK